jgi:hypothetical protein
MNVRRRRPYKDPRMRVRNESHVFHLIKVNWKWMSEEQRSSITYVSSAHASNILIDTWKRERALVGHQRRRAYKGKEPLDDVSKSQNLHRSLRGF